MRFRFFHCLLGFGGLLGASFGSLFALLVENLLASEQLEESLVGTIALLPCGANDARISAVAVAEAGADRIEEFHDSFVGHEIRRSETASGEIPTFAQRDHLFNDGARGLGLGNGRLDAFFDDHRSDQIAQQRAPVRGVTSEFIACNLVTHFSNPRG